MNDLLLQYAMKFVGTPYRFGGNSPILGLDCSGFVLEILNAFGHKLHDQTAHDLWKWCKVSNFFMGTRLGSLAFFGSRSKITHVGFIITEQLMIEAGGGDSTTVSNIEADKRGAFVRIRPINRRGDLVDIFYPGYSVDTYLS